MKNAIEVTLKGVNDNKTHSYLGASSCERYWNCPGSVARMQKAPKSPPSEYAAEGNVAHDLLELLTKGKHTKATLMKLSGTMIKTEDGFSIKITGEMLDAVFLHFDTVVADFRALQSNGRAAAVQTLIEQKVTATSVDPAVCGTLDTALVQKGCALNIYDFKYGQGKVVEVTDNKQLLQYALSAVDTLGTEAFDAIILCIVQPRAAHADGPVRRWSITPEVLRKFREDLKKVVAATREKDAPINAGDWCRWCSVKVDCPAMFALVQKETATDFSAAGLLTPVRSLLSPDDMTPEQMARALSFEDIIGKWFDAIRERVQGRLERGEAVPGWKLVDARSNRIWGDESKVIAAFEDTMGDSLYQPRKLRSPADLEVTVGKKQVAALCIKPTPKKTIAPESDARKATDTSSAASDFKHLEVGKSPEKEAQEQLLGDLIG